MASNRDPGRGARRPRRSREAWVEEVGRQRASGLGVREYAAVHQLDPGTLAGWSSRLRNTAAPNSGPTTSFLPVRVAAPRPEARPEQSGGLELVLPGGRVIRVADDFDEKALLRLVRALEGGVAC